MKKSTFIAALFFTSLFAGTRVNAQIGTITTFAPITACNIAVDHVGKVYTASGAHVYRVDSGGAETSVVGGGTVYGGRRPCNRSYANQCIQPRV